MLKTNSAAVRAKLRKYITDNFDPNGYDLPPAQSFNEISSQIMTTFRREKQYTKPYVTERQNFSDWCFGLPSILCCDFLLGDTTAFVAELLEESPQQAAKYTDSESSNLMIHLIYNELSNNEKKSTQK